MTTHNAPSVVYPVGRSRFQGWLLAALWFSGLVCVALWFRVAGHAAWHFPLAMTGILGAALAAYSGWKNLPSGQLVWDGAVWRWESPGYQTGIAEYALSVVADFQHILLLRLENQARANLWLWAERGAFPERWLDLRRAVYSPRPSPTSAGPADGPPAAVAVSAPMSSVDAMRAEP